MIDFLIGSIPPIKNFPRKDGKVDDTAEKRMGNCKYYWKECNCDNVE
jgi:hypothetical protein